MITGWIDLPSVVVREIVNGMWFVLTLCLSLTFLCYLARRIRTKTDWYFDPTTQAAIALSCHFVGAMLRSGWVWIYLNCQNRTPGHCEQIAHGYDWLLLASAFAIIGALCAIRVFTPLKYNPWTWIVAGVAAIAIPIIAHLI